MADTAIRLDTLRTRPLLRRDMPLGVAPQTMGRAARPIFLGLVLGEMTCAGIWAIIGMATGISTGYRILLD